MRAIKLGKKREPEQSKTLTIAVVGKLVHVTSTGDLTSHEVLGLLDVARKLTIDQILVNIGPIPPKAGASHD